MVFSSISPLPHTFRDCTLCKRLDGKRLFFSREYPDKSPGHELILPEETKPCVPMVRLNACGHYYHAHCLARSNPAKYTNIDARGSEGVIHFDEYDCLDCAGTQPNNSTFHPEVDAGTVQGALGEYTNSHDIFDLAEDDVDLYNERLVEMRKMVNIYTILNTVDTRRSAVQKTLDELYLRARNYLRIVTDDGIPGPGNSVRDMFLFKQNGHTLNEVPYGTFLNPITVEYNMERLRVKELNIRQLYAYPSYPNYTGIAAINHLNHIVAEFKKYMAGEPNTVTELEQLGTVRNMIFEPTDRVAPFCVLNRHGQPKQFVVFDDFPITENPGSCSISGGTRKYAVRYKRKSTRLQTKLIRNRY